MNEITIVPISTDEAEIGIRDAEIFLEGSRKINIVNQCGYEDAAKGLKDIKIKYNILDARRKEITKPLDEAKSKVMELFSKPLEILAEAERKIKSAMVIYSTEQERKTREEQARLQALAEKEAERQRKALEARIANAELKGKEEKVEELQLLKEQIMPIVVTVAPQQSVPKGVSFRDLWRAEVVEVALVPREYMIPNQSALDKIAMATKGTIQIPGVKFVSKTIMSSR